MSESNLRRILVVANRTAATPTLLEEVRKRAAAGPAEVTLLVPAFPTVFDPEALESLHSVELAVPLLAQASGGSVKAILGDPEAFTAVRDALKETRYDEVIISTLPARVSRWLKRDLPRRVEQLGVPVTVVTAPPAAGIVAESAVPQAP
jgi:hypothetical protein